MTKEVDTKVSQLSGVWERVSVKDLLGHILFVTPTFQLQNRC